MSALPDISWTVPPRAASLVPTDVILAHHPLLARAVLLLSSFKEPLVSLPAMMASLPLDQFVKVAQLDAKNAPKISSVTIVLMDSMPTRATVTLSAQEEPSETSQLETGSVLPATLPAKLASTTLHSAPAASTDKDTSRPQLSHNLVS